MIAPLLLVSVFGSLVGEPARAGRADPLVRLSDVLKVHTFLTTDSTEEFFELYREWWFHTPAGTKARIAPLLVPALQQRKLIVLKDTSAFQITYRFKIGEMKPLGIGAHHFQQDVFLTGGRAAAALGHLIGDKNLAVLDGGLKDDEWKKRATAIEAKVKTFAEKAAKEPQKKK